MTIVLDKDRAICPQIAEYLCTKIAREDVQAGEKLPSVRDIALEAGVNPNTVQKSFELLEKEGLIYSVRGSGWFVGGDRQKAKETVLRLAAAKTQKYFDEMRLIGFDAEQTKDYAGRYSHE